MFRLRRTPPDAKTWHREVLPYIDDLRTRLQEAEKARDTAKAENIALRVKLADRIESRMDLEELERGPLA